MVNAAAAVKMNFTLRAYDERQRPAATDRCRPNLTDNCNDIPNPPV